MKLTRQKMSEAAYSDIVKVEHEKHYEVDTQKIKSDDYIECPHDEDSFISGIQDDGAA